MHGLRTKSIGTERGENLDAAVTPESRSKEPKPSKTACSGRVLDSCILARNSLADVVRSIPLTEMNLVLAYDWWSHTTKPLQQEIHPLPHCV